MYGNTVETEANQHSTAKSHVHVDEIQYGQVSSVCVCVCMCIYLHVCAWEYKHMYGNTVEHEANQHSTAKSHVHVDEIQYGQVSSVCVCVCMCIYLHVCARKYKHMYGNTAELEANQHSTAKSHVLLTKYCMDK
jgi:hypothetical protein